MAEELAAEGLARLREINDEVLLLACTSIF
jgi:hypothetical protein